MKIKEKQELARQERLKQTKGFKKPSAGFFTCKASKNASLFESKLFNVIGMPNADIKPLNEIMNSTRAMYDTPSQKQSMNFTMTRQNTNSQLLANSPNRSSHYMLYSKSPLMRYTT